MTSLIRLNQPDATAPPRPPLPHAPWPPARLPSSALTELAPFLPWPRRPFVCPVDHSFEIPNWVGAGLEWREHSFFTNPAAPAGMLDQAVAVRVGPGGTTGSQASQLKLPVRDGDGDGHPAGGGRSVAVAAGATFAQAVAAIKASSAASDAEVLTIDAADLGRLCRCLAGLPEVHDLAERLPRLLANSYHYCDTTDNPYFVACKKAGRPGCRKHKTYLMNVSRGVQAPPALPTTGCGHGSTCMAYQVPSQHITEGVIGATSK